MSWVADFDYDGLSNQLALIDSFETAVSAVQAANSHSAFHTQRLLTAPRQFYDKPWQKWEGRELGAIHLPQLSLPEPVKVVHSQGSAFIGGDYDRYYQSFFVLGPFPSGAVSRELVTSLKHDRFELWLYLVGIGEKIVP